MVEASSWPSVRQEVAEEVGVQLRQGIRSSLEGSWQSYWKRSPKTVESGEEAGRRRLRLLAVEARPPWDRKWPCEGVEVGVDPLAVALAAEAEVVVEEEEEVASRGVREEALEAPRQSKDLRHPSSCPDQET